MLGQCVWDGAKYVAYSRHEFLGAGKGGVVYVFLPQIANNLNAAQLSVFVSIANENCTNWIGVNNNGSEHNVNTGNAGVFKEPKFEIKLETKFLADRWIAEQIFGNNSGLNRFVSTRVEFTVPKDKDDYWLITGIRDPSIPITNAVQM